jgi:predicted nucleic acid-binding protein
MKRVLIDTDVILDFFFDRKPFSDDASRVFSLCESGRIIGYVTPVIVSNVYYLLRQTAKHEKVTEKLHQLVSFLEVLIMDKNIIVQALNSGFKDFEDALQNYAAEINGEVEIILTRNVKDYKNSALSVMTPADFLKLRTISEK